MEPIWVLPQAVLAIHEESLAEHGGATGIRDAGLLDSALARPKNLLSYSEVEPSLERLAAAYAYGIASNHPFVDGNKRTSLVTSLTFLRINGIKVTASKPDLYLTFLGLANGTVSEIALADWLTRNSSPLTQP
jgi:death on curing protein